MESKTSALSKDLQKQFKIKTGSCKRLVTDFHSYQKEKNEYETKLNSLLSDKDADKYALKLQQDLISESNSVLNDINKKLTDTSADLQSFFDAHFESFNEDEKNSILTILNNVKLIL